MVKAKELKALSDQELDAMYNDLKNEIFQMKCARALQKEEVKPNQLRDKRKNIARILTIKSERKASNLT